ncbi:aspartate aminotransferase family protein [Actinocrinis puniceicyclus]|uniref:Aspartate aminotransferase family protein n=1 Tax=Actinocrinis puniceicyclus TaxID=977794 RepID=A0A8J8BCR6_9ACTN|nr:aspartate aminotransferase family protein [Actinocrinis puniceicyclus]MBS2962049.1 aspartate aminotransferase family protein [Actinocrinis puniceicyclus]
MTTHRFDTAPHSPALRVLAARESPSMAATIGNDIGVALTRGRGTRVWDEDGREYLDLTAGSGVHALGHAHPAVLAAMQAQLAEFAHGGWQFSCPARARLTERLCTVLPWPDPMILWCTTGSEAVEAVLKVARAATGRRQVLGFLGGYHGKTSGALTVTANAAFRADVTEVPVAGLSLPYPVAPGHVPPGAAPGRGHRFGQEILDHPDFGGADVAGLIVETVQGAGGMQAAAPGLLTELRRHTAERGQLLILDEIFTGFGRTGAMFGFCHEDVQPDLVVLGKALGGGLPVAAVAGPRELLGALAPLRQTSTFSANPVACAAGVAVLDVLQTQQMPARAAVAGQRLVDAVRALQVPGVRLEAIGRGLMTGVRVAQAPDTDRGAFTRGVVRRMREAGVLALRGGADGAVIKWTPPLNISDADLDLSVEVLAAALGGQAEAAQDRHTAERVEV